MIASAEDARLLFHRWQYEGVRLRIRMLGPKLVFDGSGGVTTFTPDMVQLGGDSWSFTVPLEGVSYAFSDPREIPIASVREAETAKYELGLAMRLSNGDELVLMEWKTPLPTANSEED